MGNGFDPRYGALQPRPNSDYPMQQQPSGMGLYQALRPSGFGETDNRMGSMPMAMSDMDNIGKPGALEPLPTPAAPPPMTPAPVDPAYQQKVELWKRTNEALRGQGKPPKPWPAAWGPMPR